VSYKFLAYPFPEITIRWGDEEQSRHLPSEAVLLGHSAAEAIRQAGREFRKQARDERLRIKREYGAIFDDISTLLYAEDPIDVTRAIGATHEYDREVGTILPPLRSCATAEDVAEVVFEEFVRRFTADVAGAKERYGQVSQQIWEAWQRYSEK